MRLARDDDATSSRFTNPPAAVPLSLHSRQWEPAFDLDQKQILRCVFTSARLGEWRRKRISEYEHDHFEDSHDCSRVARGWNFAGDGSERSSDWRPTAGGWRRW